jgi:hypothetical protein
MMCGVGFAGSLFSGPVTSIYTGSDAIDTGNSVIVAPSDDLQDQYDWLKSSDRDSDMGALSSNNRRTLILVPGEYNLSTTLILDTDYVDIDGSPNAFIKLAGNPVTITADDATIRGITLNDTDQGIVVTYPKTFDAARTYTGKSFIPKYINAFENVVHGQEFFQTSCVISQDTINYKTGDNSVKMTANPTAINFSMLYWNSSNKFNPPLDWTNYNFACRFYIHPGSGSSDPSTIASIAFQILDTSGRATTWKIYNPVGVDVENGSGWKEWSLPISNFFSESAGFDITLIESFNFIVTKNNTTDTPVVTIDSMTVIPQESTPLCMIRLDDALDLQYDLCAYITKKGLTATVGAIGEKIGTSTFMSLAQLQLLRDSGILICNHLWYSDEYFDVQSDAQILDSFLRMQAWMEQNGLGEGSRVIIVPGGKWPEGVYELLRPYLDFAWLSKDLGGSNSPSTTYNRYFSLGQPGDADSLATLNTKLQDAIDDGAVHSPYWHDDNVTPNFEDHVDQIAVDFAAGNIDVTTPVGFQK